MGAGVQRWWRESSSDRLARECEEWRVGTRAHLAQVIIHAPARQVRLLQPLMTAWAKLWMLLAGEVEDDRPPPTRIPGSGVRRQS